MKHPIGLAIVLLVVVAAGILVWRCSVKNPQTIACDCYGRGYRFGRAGVEATDPRYETEYQICRRAGGNDAVEALGDGWEDGRSGRRRTQSCPR